MDSTRAGKIDKNRNIWKMKLLTIRINLKKILSRKRIFHVIFIAKNLFPYISMLQQYYFWINFLASRNFENLFECWYVPKYTKCRCLFFTLLDFKWVGKLLSTLRKMFQDPEKVENQCLMTFDFFSPLESLVIWKNNLWKWIASSKLPFWNGEQSPQQNSESSKKVEVIFLFEKRMKYLYNNIVGSI